MLRKVLNIANQLILTFVRLFLWMGNVVLNMIVLSWIFVLTSDGKIYQDGQTIYNFGEGSDPCFSLYCSQGNIEEAHIDCAHNIDGPPPGYEFCTPVYEQGRCCPVSYDCSKAPCSYGGKMYQHGEAVFAVEGSDPCLDLYCSQGKVEG
ncbi:CLUMA_CG008327, isoform B, partial [Clunio marinus]